MTVNKVILIGNLGADPELRETGGGVPVCNLRIATSDRRKEGDQWVDVTEWHSVVCFGRTADNVARYMEKGRQIYIEGKIRTRKWTDKEGRDRWSTEVIGDVVRFLAGGASAAPRDNTGIGYRDDIHEIARKTSGAPLDRPARGHRRRQSDPPEGERRKPPGALPAAPDDDLPF